MAKSSQRIRSACVQLAAGQWKAMGVALAGGAAVGSSVIDPEALICFTAALGDADARLRDEATDWCIQFGSRLISVSRLRNTRKLFPSGCGAKLDAFFATVNAQGRTRWAKEQPDAPPRRIRASGKSTIPRLLESEALLRLQLRALFGVTARAEVILALCTAKDDFVTASELSTTGYGKRNIALVLEDLALSEVVATKRIANRLGYRLEAKRPLAKLAPGLRTASLARWAERLALLIASLAMIDRVDSKAPTLRSIEARRFIEDHAHRLDTLELRAPAIDEPERYFEAIVDWVIEELVHP